MRTGDGAERRLTRSSEKANIYFMLVKIDSDGTNATGIGKIRIIRLAGMTYAYMRLHEPRFPRDIILFNPE